MEFAILIVALIAAIAALAALAAVLRLNKNRDEAARPGNDEYLLKQIQGENARMMDYVKSLLGIKGEALSADVNRQGDFQRERLERLEAGVRELMASTEQRLAGLSRTLDANMRYLAEDNAKQLDKMREVVDEKLNATLETRLAKSFNIIQTTLDNVYKGLSEMHSLTASVGDLNKVLSNVKTRGIWGEVQLNALLEQILTENQYLKNALINAQTGERVEFAVRLPGKGEGSVLLPIDAKFPLDQYQKLVDASENMDKLSVEKYSKELDAAVREQAKKISAKYILPPLTTDFAILYLPVESLYAEVVKRPGLCESLQRDSRIVVCGPTTLSALLNSLQLGFKTVAIEKRGTELWKLLSAFKVEFCRFTEILEKSQKKLEEASRTLDDATRKTQRIRRKLNSVEEISGVEADGFLEIDD